MDYWARIKGKDYPIAFGFTLTEEFSETLDSMAITLPHVSDRIDIKPYDDVIVHDYGENGLPPRGFHVRFVPEAGHFYRHMLVHSFSRENVHLDGDRSYNYSIQLMSETKGLEAVQLPNRTITQPRGTDAGSLDAGVSDAKPNFNIGDEYLTIPYSVVDSWKDGIAVYEGSGRKTTVFVGDMVPETNDYSRFTDMPLQTIAGDEFRLPDWNISAVAVAYGESGTGGSYRTFNAKKHWILTKYLSEMDDAEKARWPTRDAAIATIQAFLAGASYPEILNGTGTIPADLSSDEQVAYKKISMDRLGSYDVYLYVEPVMCPIYRGSETTFNVFSVTDNSKGKVPPTDSSAKPFLAKWSAVSVDRSEASSKKALSVYEAVRQAVELYSPYIKVTDNASGGYGNWRYERKYAIDPETANKFRNVVAPENQWNYPNLRDYITRLFYVADCIPVVHDGVIGHMDLSSRYPMPFDETAGNRSFDTYSMDGSSYCDRLLRNYTDGLSKDNVTKCVERVGFKCSDSSTLTLDNMRLELTHPIYQIDKIYLCYYNRYADGTYGLCKQDITPIVLVNAQRNMLTEDWNSTEAMLKAPVDISYLSKYKFATVGYDIGSRYITGWGVKYTHPQNVYWKTERSVIENIFEFVRTSTPNGVEPASEDIFPGISETAVSNADTKRTAWVTLGSGYGEHEITAADQIEYKYGAFIGDFTQQLKSMVFIVEYRGYVSASVLASKDMHDGDVVSRDNASSSLSFVESDGVNQKEKVNRLGNATRTVSFRYASPDSVAPLSSVWDDGDEHEDEVLYKKTVAYNKDYVTASYYFCRDYVLRNYFTSVYSRHRPFPLASYEESVERQENRTMEVLFSADSSYWQSTSKRVGFDTSASSDSVPLLLSFYKRSEYDNVGNPIVENGLDSAYYLVYPSRSATTFRYAGQCGVFGTDMQKFTSGNSLCVSIAMNDNVSGGVYVSDMNHKLSAFIGDTFQKTFNLAAGDTTWLDSNDAIQTTSLLTGAKQDWLMFPVDKRTGFLYQMGFGVGFRENDVYAIDGRMEYDADVTPYNIAQAQLLPLMDAVVERYDGTSVYFGKIGPHGKAIGSGYPRISFRKESNGKYDAYVSYPEITYASSDWLVDLDESSGFESAGNDPIDVGDRTRLKEFASAIFSGSETDSPAEREYDTCVFKDGKERIVTTIQFEPVSEDGRIMFSEYMMKLSDAMGGLGKNYRDENLNVGDLLYDYRTVNVAYERYKFYDSHLYTINGLFSFPVFSLGVYEQKLKYLEGKELNIEFQRRQNNGGGYFRFKMIRVKETGQDENTGYRYVDIDCEYGFQHETQIIETMHFVETRYDDADDYYVDNNTGTELKISDVHRQFGFGYITFTYVMCSESFYFDGSANDIASLYMGQADESGSHYESADLTKDAQDAINKKTLMRALHAEISEAVITQNIPTGFEYEFERSGNPDGDVAYRYKTIYEIKDGREYGYEATYVNRRVREMYDTVDADKYVTLVNARVGYFIGEWFDAGFLGGEIRKTKNMQWGFSPDTLSYDTPYTSPSSVSEIFSQEFSSDTESGSFPKFTVDGENPNISVENDGLWKITFRIPTFTDSGKRAPEKWRLNDEVERPLGGLYPSAGTRISGPFQCKRANGEMVGFRGIHYDQYSDALVFEWDSGAEWEVYYFTTGWIANFEWVRDIYLPTQPTDLFRYWLGKSGDFVSYYGAHDDSDGSGDLSENGGSLRLYYTDDAGSNHFVFGANIGPKGTAEEDRKPNLIYPDENGIYTIWVSFLDDRSRSVLDIAEGSPTQGEYAYRVLDFAKDGIAWSGEDICVEK